MKTSLVSMVATVLIGVLVTGVSCKNATVNLERNVASDFRVPAAFAKQTTQFAFDVFKNVVPKEGQDKNVFISPLSLHMALGMMLNGANGQTAREIQKTLSLDTLSLEETNRTYRNLMENLPGVDKNVTLNLANSVWYQNSFSIEPIYQDLISQSFQAEVSAQDFNDPATLSKINGWASQKTNGKIPKVLNQIQPNQIMFLLNALYFKGDWKTRFDADKTTNESFKLSSGSTKTVRMMRLNTAINRAYRPTYTAFELPYGSEKFAMTVLLPAETITVDELVNSLSHDEWMQLQQLMREATMDIGLPRFTMNYEIKLNNALSALGMPTAFSGAADFTKINAEGGLMLDFVKQNTFLAIDEQGTEAAAVTTGAVKFNSGPLPVICNRPFVFLIHEKTSGTILFVGKIADPTSTGS
ncbi:serpin family protein [Spirosoma gilvum]